MKRKKLTVVFILALIMLTALPVLAKGQPGFPYITDQAGLLRKDQRIALERQAADISEQYDCGVYLMVLEDYAKLATSMETCAQMLYEQYNLGLGGDKDGFMLLISMKDRDYWLLAHGNFANKALSDYGNHQLAEAFLPELGKDNWYEGFRTYLDESAYYLEEACSGHPVQPQKQTGTIILIAAGVSVAIAAAVCLVAVGQMKTAVKKADAEQYVPADGIQINHRTDVYTHTTTVRTPVAKVQNNKTTVSSGGYSGSGGKF